MPSYDATDCDPPAAVAQVTLRSVHNGEMVADVPLLLDTGADVTLLPHNTVEQLGVQPAAGQRYELMGFNGSTSSAPVVMLDLLFLKRAFRGRYLVIEEGRGIMGRDTLNYVALSTAVGWSATTVVGTFTLLIRRAVIGIQSIWQPVVSHRLLGAPRRAVTGSGATRSLCSSGCGSVFVAALVTLTSSTLRSGRRRAAGGRAGRGLRRRTC